MRRSALVVAIALLASLVAAGPAAVQRAAEAQSGPPSISPFVSCNGASGNLQLCSPPFQASVVGNGGSLKFTFVAPSACSEFILTSFLGGQQFNVSFVEQGVTVQVATGTVLASGTSYTLEWVGSGFPNGCNNGQMFGWSGTLTFTGGVASVTSSGLGTGVKTPNLAPLGGAITNAELRGGANPAGRCRSSQGCHGDPVNSYSGEFTEPVTDILLAGRGAGLSFTRTYSSYPGEVVPDGPLGFGWTGTYLTARLATNSDGSVTVTQDNGAQVRFVTGANRLRRAMS
jgi:hypothetical protein